MLASWSNLKNYGITNKLPRGPLVNQTEVNSMIITKYRCFTRNWWADNSAYPNGLEPCGTCRKTYRGTFITESTARQYCEEWNKSHNPGRYSNKMEYEEIKKRGKYNALLGREV